MNGAVALRRIHIPRGPALGVAFVMTRHISCRAVRHVLPAFQRVDTIVTKRLALPCAESLELTVDWARGNNVHSAVSITALNALTMGAVTEH